MMSGNVSQMVFYDAIKNKDYASDYRSYIPLTKYTSISKIEVYSKTLERVAGKTSTLMAFYVNDVWQAGISITNFWNFDKIGTSSLRICDIYRNNYTDITCSVIQKDSSSINNRINDQNSGNTLFKIGDMQTLVILYTNAFEYYRISIYDGDGNEVGRYIPAQIGGVSGIVDTLSDYYFIACPNCVVYNL